jgi:hypothetical protein
MDHATIEPSEEGLRVRLQATFATPQNDESVELSIVIPAGNHTLLEIQEQASYRAKLILDLLCEAARQSPDSKGGQSESALAIWEKLGR